jgi:hypothetical protein
VPSGLVFPEVSKPTGCQFRVAHHVLNVLVAEIKLNRPRVLAVVCEIEAGCVAEHVRMDRKFDAGHLGGFGDHVMEHAPRHRVPVAT